MKKYKVGDIVYIKSLSWYQNSPKSFSGSVDVPHVFTAIMNAYCGRKAKIEEINTHNEYAVYLLDVDDNHFGWTEQMFDETKSRKEKLEKLSNNERI